MAKITGQNVPPSISKIYHSVIRRGQGLAAGGNSAGLNRTVLKDDSADPRPRLIQQAESAALWIQQHRAKYLSSSDAQAFKNMRKREILTGEYPAEFWSQLNQLSVNVQRGAIVVSPAFRQPAPPYYDADRLASDVGFTGVAESYAVPAAHTSGAQPSAGWRAEVIDGYIKDLYAAQLHFIFELPEPYSPASVTPLFARRQVVQELSASNRPNSVWLNSIVHFDFTEILAYSGGARDRFYSSYRTEQSKLITLNPPATPWAQTIDTTTQIDVLGSSPFFLPQRKWSICNYLHCKVAPISPHGLFFSGNDWAQCWLSADVDIFKARAI